MIAKNYIRYPDALRFQVEMFSNGYKNSPRIMRLMTVIFKQIADVPAWVKEAAAAAKRLVKMWKAAQIVLNFAAPFSAMKEAKKLQAKGWAGYMDCRTGDTWTGRGQEPKWVKQSRKAGTMWWIPGGQTA